MFFTVLIYIIMACESYFGGLGSILLEVFFGDRDLSIISEN
jgi:hypothetical protein